MLTIVFKRCCTDPNVFGPPGSGSVIICMDAGVDPAINKQKK
jgi:hypothetical protein